MKFFSWVTKYVKESAEWSGARKKTRKQRYKDIYYIKPWGSAPYLYNRERLQNKQLAQQSYD